MGIHDRDYARPSSNRGFGGGMHRPQKLSVNAWLIISCIAVFVLDPFIGYTFREWLHLSTTHAFDDLQYWRVIGFQFLHVNMPHLIFNMIGLYFFGPMVEQFLGGKRYLAFYLLCGIFGAALFLLLNYGGYWATEWGLDAPILLFNDPSTPLIGASAGVMGVLLAGAFLAPKVRVLLFLVIPMQLSTLAYIFVGWAVCDVVFGLTSNTGGEAAHLGGAVAGWYFIRNPHHLNGFFDFLGRADPTSKHFALGKKKTVRSDVDKILDKIHRKGLNSLSTKEKKILHDASQDRREGK